MSENGFAIVYIISNLFCTMDIILFYNTFFGKQPKIWGYAYYLLFYIVVSIEYLTIGIPVVTLLINIIGLFALTHLYKASIKTKCICVLFCYALYILAEAIVMGVTGYLAFSYISRTEYKSYVGMGCLPLIFYVIVMMMRAFKKGEKGEVTVPAVHWVIILLIPLSSAAITVIVHTISGIMLWQIILIETIMFLVTIGVYYLYMKQMVLFKMERDHIVAERQLEAYKNQLEMILETEDQTVSIRHDMKNHLLAIREYASDSHDTKVVEYVDAMSGYIPSANIISTGNKTMDAIVNSKLYVAKKENILIKTNIRVEGEMVLSDYETTILFGNILDNILENAKEEASLTVRSNKGRIIIKSSNKYETMKGTNEEWNTTEMTPDKYGTGLKNVLSIVEKHGGEMHTKCDDAIYSLEMILYV